QIQLEPRVSRREAAPSKRLVRMVPGSARNWIAINAVQQFSLNKKENKKYDNSRLKKFDQPLVCATRFPSHPAPARLLCAFTDSASGRPGARWSLPGLQHS